MLIGHALVGTFLGILIAYGFVLPLATLLRQMSSDQVKILQCIKVTLLSSLNGYAPQIAVEFGRKPFLPANGLPLRSLKSMCGK